MKAGLKMWTEIIGQKSLYAACLRKRRISALDVVISSLSRWILHNLKGVAESFAPTAGSSKIHDNLVLKTLRRHSSSNAVYTFTDHVRELSRVQGGAVVNLEISMAFTVRGWISVFEIQTLKDFIEELNCALRRSHRTGKKYVQWIFASPCYGPLRVYT